MTNRFAGIALAACFACASTSSTLVADDPPGDGTCPTYDEQRCLSSSECTLVQLEEHGPYQCRAAVPPCEVDFDQSKATSEACQAREGCRFVPGYCYCSPGLTCICGGGPPPRCVADSSEGSGDAGS